MQWYKIYISKNDAEKRLDSFCKKIFPLSHYSSCAQWTRNKILKINNKKTTPNQRLTIGDYLFIAEPIINKLSSKAKKVLSPVHTSTQATSNLLDNQNIELQNSLITTQSIKNLFPAKKILFETSDIIALQKDAGELLFGHQSIAQTLSKYPTHSLGFIASPSHRIDINTSGIVLCSLSIRGARYLQRLHQSSALHKVYVALLSQPAYNHTLNHHLYRDEAKRITHAYNTPQHTNSKYLGRTSLYLHTLCEVSIPPKNLSHNKKTKVYPSIIILGGSGGKTHQIRAQCAQNSTPLWSDKKYQTQSIKFSNWYKETHTHQSFYLHTGLILQHKLLDEYNTQSQPATPPMPILHIKSQLPQIWFDIIDYEDFDLLYRIERGLDIILRKWEDTNFWDCNTDIIDFCNSTFGRVMGYSQD